MSKLLSLNLFIFRFSRLRCPASWGTNFPCSKSLPVGPVVYTIAVDWCGLAIWQLDTSQKYVGAIRAVGTRGRGLFARIEIFHPITQLRLPQNINPKAIADA